MKYDYFVSGKWRNKDNILDLVSKIRAKGYSVYCFLEDKEAMNKFEGDAEKEMEQFEKLNWRNDEYVASVFKKDMDGERNSENFVMLLPAGKSCHIEAGVAFGLGKKCILIGEQTEAESLYLIFSESHQTVDEFLNSI